MSIGESVGSVSRVPVIMGILNVTPDSFSDGGSWLPHDAAVRHALALVEQGADIIDIGGESTRPGAVPVDAVTETARILPVVRELVARGVRVSVDTLHANTAQLAIDEGVEFINDVSGGLADARMAEVVAASRATFIAAHWGGGADARYRHPDIAAGVRWDLHDRAVALHGAGIERDRLILDPGLGFGKDGDANWRLLSRLDQLTILGFRVLVGHSRKRFVGALLPESAPMGLRDAPSAVISVLAAQAGAWGVRVHDVAATRLAFDVLARWQNASVPELLPEEPDLQTELIGLGHA